VRAVVISSVPVTSAARTVRQLRLLHAELDACTACPNMIRPVVHGPPVASGILLVGQAPGPREGGFGRPFAWTAGKTLFRWFEETIGVGEEEFRAKVYIAAVARCFPGKASGGGDRRPDADEVARCRPFLARETAILQPKLVLPVGTMAIEQVLATKEKLNELIGTVRKATYHGVAADVVPLPHPSGASPWHKMEPGKTLLGRALREIAKHPEVKRTFGR
jgi:uracil-DNA glycosylase